MTHKSVLGPLLACALLACQTPSPPKPPAPSKPVKTEAPPSKPTSKTVTAQPEPATIVPTWTSPDALPPGATARIGSKAWVSTSDVVAVSNDGRVLTSYKGFGIVEYRHDGQWRTLAPYDEIHDAHYKADGGIVVSTSNTLLLITPQLQLQTLRMPCSNYGARIAFSEDLSLYACITEDHNRKRDNVSIFAVGSTTPKAQRTVRKAESLALSNSGMLAVVSDGGRLEVFDDAGQSLWFTDKPFSNTVAFDERTNQVVALNRNKYAFSRFDTTSGKRAKPGPEKHFDGKKNVASGYVFGLRDGRLASAINSGGSRYTTGVWQPDGTFHEWTTDQYIKDVSFSPNGDWFAVIDRVGTLLVTNLKTGKVIHNGAAPNAIVNMQGHHDSARLIVGRGDGALEIFDVPTQARVAAGKTEDPVSSIFQFAFSPKGDLVAVGDRYGRLGIFDADTLAPVCTASEAPAMWLFWEGDRIIAIGNGFDDWLYSGAIRILKKDCTIVHAWDRPGGIWAEGLFSKGRLTIAIDDASYDDEPTAFQRWLLDPSTLTLSKVGNAMSIETFQHPHAATLPPIGELTFPVSPTKNRYLAWTEYIYEDEVRGAPSSLILRMEDSKTGNELARFTLPQSSYGDLAVSEDGRWIAVVDQGTILIYAVSEASAPKETPKTPPKGTP